MVEPNAINGKFGNISTAKQMVRAGSAFFCRCLARRNSNKPMEAAWSLGFLCSVFRVFPYSFPHVS